MADKFDITTIGATGADLFADIPEESTWSETWDAAQEVSGLGNIERAAKRFIYSEDVTRDKLNELDGYFGSEQMSKEIEGTNIPQDRLLELKNASNSVEDLRWNILQELNIQAADEVLSNAGMFKTIVTTAVSEVTTASPALLAGGGVAKAAIAVGKGVKAGAKAASVISKSSKLKAGSVAASVGAYEGLVITAMDDYANIRNYDSGDYAMNMGIGAAMGGTLGYLLGGADTAITKTNKIVDEDGDVTLVNNKDTGSNEVLTIAEEDVAEIVKSGFFNSIVNFSKSLSKDSYRQGLNKALAKIDEEITRTETNIKKFDDDIAEEKLHIKDKTKVIDDEYAPLERGATKRQRKDKTLSTYSDEVFKSGDIPANKLNDVETLTNFIQSRAGTLSTKLGTFVEAGKKVNEVKELISKHSEAEELLTQYNQMSSAHKIVEHNNATDKLKQLGEEKKLRIKEETADETASIAKKNKRKLEQKGLNKVANKNKEDILQELKRLDELPDDVTVSLAPIKYAAMKSMDDLEKKAFTAETKGEVREYALEVGDDEFVDMINATETIPDFDTGALTTEELLEVGKALEANQSRGLLNAFRSVLPIGVLMNMSESAYLRGFSAKILRNNMGNKEGSQVAENAASDFKETFERKYKSQLTNIINSEYKKYVKRNDIGGMANTRLHWSTQDSADFNNMIYDAANYLDFDDFEALGELPVEAVNAAKRLQGMVADMRKSLIKNDPTLTDEQLAMLTEDLNKGFMSRVRSDEFYVNTSVTIDKVHHIDIHEGAIVKGVPEINFILRKNQLDRKAVKEALTSDEIEELARLEKDIEKVQALRKDNRLTDAEVDKIIAKSGDNRYSRMIAEVMYDNQLSRSNSVNVVDKGGIREDDIMSVLEKTGAAEHIPENTRNIIKQYVNNRKAKDNTTSTNPFMSRMTLDTTYQRHVPTKAGGVEKITMKDYYNNHAENVLQSTVNKYSGLYGLRKVGVNTFEDFDKMLGEAKSRLNEIPASKRNGMKKSLDRVENYIKGQAQYDRSHPIWKFVDIAKNMMAGVKLTFLPLGILTEAMNIIAMNGFSQTMKAIPAAFKTYKAIRNGDIEMDDSFVATLYNLGGNSLDPMRNYIANTDTGVDIISGKSDSFSVNALEKARRASATYAKGLSAINESFDTITRLVNTQSSALNMFNADAKKLNSQLFRDHGMTEEMIKDIQFIQNSKYVTKSPSGKIIDVDYRQLAKDKPEFSDNFMTTLVRLTDRTIQNSTFADLPPWANTAAFSWLGQFKSFMLGSFTNQLGYNVARPSAYAAYMFTGQYAMSSLMYAARIKVMYHDDKEKLDELLSPTAIALNALRGTGYGALLTTITGSAFGIATGTDPFAAGSKTGQTAISSSMDVLDSSTVIRFYKDAFSLFESARQYALGGEPSQYKLQKGLGIFIPPVIAKPLSGMISENLGTGKAQYNFLQQTQRDYYNQ